MIWKPLFILAAALIVIFILCMHVFWFSPRIDHSRTRWKELMQRELYEEAQPYLDEADQLQNTQLWFNITGLVVAPLLLSAGVIFRPKALK